MSAAIAKLVKHSTTDLKMWEFNQWAGTIKLFTPGIIYSVQ